MLKTLKGKITLVYICLVIMIAVIGSASVLNLYRLSKSIDGLMVDNYKSINAISYMLGLLNVKTVPPLSILMLRCQSL
ncbi:MAG: hypothetical protein ACYCYE_04815 [Clostridia bacterium]